MNPRRSGQRGAAALVVVVLLLLAIGWIALHAQQRHVVELRAAGAAARSGQAFEAAEAGLAWATARLDDPRPLDAACRPAAGATASFRDGHLAIAAETGLVTPLAAPGPSPRSAACTRDAAGWRCACPLDASAADAGAVLAAEAGGAATADADTPAAFTVRFLPGTRAGTVVLEATGCLRAPCATGSAGPDTTRLAATLGLLPGLVRAPLAALTVRGDVDTPLGAPGLHNADAATGLAVHAGGVVQAPHARWSGPPGAPDGAQAAGDTALRDTPAEHLFAALFGLDRAAWAARTQVASVRCDTPCSDALAAAQVHHRVLHVPGDAALDGPLALGRPGQPVLVVVDGTARLRGAVVLHGLLYAGDLHWDAAPAGAQVRGALVSEGSYRGDAAPELVYDPAVLARLRALGTFARLPGGWRDFR